MLKLWPPRASATGAAGTTGVGTGPIGAPYCGDGAIARGCAGATRPAASAGVPPARGAGSGAGSAHAAARTRSQVGRTAMTTHEGARLFCCHTDRVSVAAMRIYFVGSHATGKTTLARYVSRRYGLPMISEVARAVLAEMETSLEALRTDMDLVAEYQERVFARQVAVEKQHQGRFVSDRAFDNLAYVAEHTM